MAAATITKLLDVNDPVREVVILTVSDGETFTSKKFSSLDGASATLMEDAGVLAIPLSVALSGAVATIHCTGLVDLKVCLELYGRK